MSFQTVSKCGNDLWKVYISQYKFQKYTPDAKPLIDIEWIMIIDPFMWPELLSYEIEHYFEIVSISND